MVGVGPSCNPPTGPPEQDVGYVGVIHKIIITVIIIVIILILVVIVIVTSHDGPRASPQLVHFDLRSQLNYSGA